MPQIRLSSCPLETAIQTYRDAYLQDMETIWAVLDTSPHGLSVHEAEQRWRHVGPNRLPAPPRTRAWVRFLGQFNNPLIYVLLITATLTLVLGEWLDASVILGVVVANAIIGYIQEAKAERAISALQQMLTPAATALREGHKAMLPAEQLVPGDVVLLRGGDKVPADMRLFEANNVTASVLSRRGLLGNPVVLIGIGLVAIFQLLFTYWPAMQSLFHTTPLDAASWLRILVLSIALMLVIEAAKRFISRTGLFSAR